MTTSFAPISRSTAVEKCEEAIRARILSGAIAPGDRLPPERALAESLRVNRVTLRGALGRLASARLLSVRQGSGYQVRDFRIEGGLQLLPELTRLGKGETLVRTAQDLLLVRRQLARGVLERLASGFDRRRLPQFDEALAEFEVRVGKRAPLHDLVDADMAIFRAIVGLTGSEVLELCLNPLIAVLGAIPRLSDAIYADAPASMYAWQSLRKWLDRRAHDEIEWIMVGLAERDRMTLARLQKKSPQRRRK
jgi:DNA-binding FadR family transcriptional regulator